MREAGGRYVFGILLTQLGAGRERGMPKALVDYSTSWKEREMLEAVATLFRAGRKRKILEVATSYNMAHRGERNGMVE